MRRAKAIQRIDRGDLVIWPGTVLDLPDNEVEALVADGRAAWLVEDEPKPARKRKGAASESPEVTEDGDG